MKIPKLFLFTALMIVLLTTACGADQGTPGVAGTIIPGSLDLTSTAAFAPDTTDTPVTTTVATLDTSVTALSETPTASGAGGLAASATPVIASTLVGASRTPIVPVTGVDIVLVECQFCVDTLAHALLVLPDTATFEVTSTGTTTTTTTTTNILNTNCSTIEVNNGKQVVLCSGPEKTAITLNICTNRNTCTAFPVQLLACPLSQAVTAVPNKTQPPSGEGTGGNPTVTATTELGTATAVPVVTDTPTP